MQLKSDKLHLFHFLCKKPRTDNKIPFSLSAHGACYYSLGSASISFFGNVVFLKQLINRSVKSVFVVGDKPNRIFKFFLKYASFSKIYQRQHILYPNFFETVLLQHRSFSQNP